jgi:MFS family permease
MIRTLLGLRGNVRGCVYTEGLWGIPFNLYAPYVSVYMLGLGLTDGQIGLLISVGLIMQTFWALMSGAITDKWGRKRVTYITDFISWSIPTLIWAFSQNFTHFLVAAVFNAVWRVSANSWTCLLVEDAEQDQLVDVWSWIYISGLVAAFVAPLGGLLIQHFSLVPTMRGLYLLAFVMMTAKFIIMNEMVEETRQGVVRKRETQGQSVFSIVAQSTSVLTRIFHSPLTLYAAGLMVVMSIARMITGSFWAILATRQLDIAAEHLAYFHTARSLVMLGVYFFVMPRLRNLDWRRPMIIGFAGLVVSQALLIATPTGSYALLLVATLLEAFSLPTASTLLDKLVVVVVDKQERARIMALLYVLVIVLTSPFGWIAGRISEIDRTLPFVLNLGLFAVGAVLVYMAGRVVPVSEPAAGPEGETAGAAP